MNLSKGKQVSVFVVGEYNDGVPNNSTFADGDWNQDGDFDSSDLVLAFQAGHYVVSGGKPRMSRVAAAVDWLFAHDDSTRKTRPFLDQTNDS